MNELYEAIQELIYTVNFLLKAPKSYDWAPMISAWAAVAAAIISVIIGVVNSILLKKQLEKQQTLAFKQISVNSITDKRTLG